MSLNTYGDHAERAAAALEQLIRTGAAPASTEDHDRVLAARQAIVDALRDRLPHLGHPNRTDPGPEVGGRLTAAAITEQPSHLLAKAIRDLPGLHTDGDGQTIAPTEALGSPAGDPAVAEWGTVGRELLATGHVLDTSDIKPWLHSVEGHWQLVADTAQVLEALVVLDTQLDAAGVPVPKAPAPPAASHSPLTVEETVTARELNSQGVSYAEIARQLGHDRTSIADHIHRPPPVLARTEVRLLCGHLHRTGNWYGNPAALDLAYARADNPQPDPVLVVRAPGDLSAAQDRLRQFLITDDPWGAPAPTTPRMDATTARSIGKNQARLLVEHLGEQIARRPSLGALRERLVTCHQMVKQINDGMEGLRDIQKVARNGRAHHQQAEIMQGVVRLGGLHRFTDAQIGELLDSTEKALGSWGLATMREGRRPDSQLRILVGRGEQKYPVRIRPQVAESRADMNKPHHYLDVKLADLATYHPAGTVDPIGAPTERPNLQHTLEETATDDAPRIPQGIRAKLRDRAARARYDKAPRSTWSRRPPRRDDNPPSQDGPPTPRM